MESLLQSSKTIVLANYTTGTANTVASSVLDLSAWVPGGCEGLYFQHVVCSTATTSAQVFTIQASATTAAASFATVNKNSTAMTLTVSTGFPFVSILDVQKPTYRYWRTVHTATGTAQAGAVICTAYGVRSFPTSNNSTYTPATMSAVSPST